MCSVPNPRGIAAYQERTRPRRASDSRPGIAVRDRPMGVWAIAAVPLGASATPASDKARAWRRVIEPFLSEPNRISRRGKRPKSAHIEIHADPEARNTPLILPSRRSTVKLIRLGIRVIPRTWGCLRGISDRHPLRRDKAPHKRRTNRHYDEE